MAQICAMPPDTSEEEKIVGGYLDKMQLIWIIIGGGVGAIFGVIGFSLIGAFGLVFFLPPLFVGIVFAVRKVENMTLFQYLRYKKKFEKKTKDYINFGTHTRLYFTAVEEDTSDGY